MQTASYPNEQELFDVLDEELPLLTVVLAALEDEDADEVVEEEVAADA